MTRLTESDVRGLTAALEAFERDLSAVSGLTLRDVATRSVADDPICVPLFGARIAAVPISTGEGFIPGFCDCVAAILGHLGCEAWVTDEPDVRGIQAAADQGAQVLFLADDHRFIALDLHNGRCIDDDPATADAYVAVLEAAASGLGAKPVLLLGLGPVGLAAARRLVALGAQVHVVEPDGERLRAVLGAGLPLRPVALDEGLAVCDLVFDATPAAAIIDADRVTAETIAAVPGMPSAFTAAARQALGVRHIHEPLALGVTVMAARALS